MNAVIKTEQPVTVNTEKRSLPPKEGFCPTCGEQVIFTFLGEQHWPPKVATALGFSGVMLQWTCERCNTTLSEPDC